MLDKFIPTKKQLLGLHNLLNFLCDAEIKWHNIYVSSGRIAVKTEPLKGDFDIRIFKINEEGGIDDYEFREQIQRFD